MRGADCFERKGTVQRGESLGASLSRCVELCIEGAGHELARSMPNGRLRITTFACARYRWMRDARRSGGVVFGWSLIRNVGGVRGRKDDFSMGDGEASAIQRAEGRKLLEGAWIEAIYAQFVRDLHRNKALETGRSRAILFSTEEKSFRGESGTEASREDRQRNSIRATEAGWQTES